MNDELKTTKHPTIDDTIEFIKLAHAGQLDRSGEEYWKHPFAVMELLGPDATDVERHIALLHDVIEDTEHTDDDLYARGYSAHVVIRVGWLSRPKGVTYMSWIKSIARHGDIVTIKIKMMDIVHNTLPSRTKALPVEEREGMAKRYAKALDVLTLALTFWEAVTVDDRMP